jgi:hypothetical protein
MAQWWPEKRPLCGRFCPEQGTWGFVRSLIDTHAFSLLVADCDVVVRGFQGSNRHGVSNAAAAEGVDPSGAPANVLMAMSMPQRAKVSSASSWRCASGAPHSLAFSYQLRAAFTSAVGALAPNRLSTMGS